MATHRFAQIKVDQGITAKHHKGVVEEALEILDLLQPSCRSHRVADQLTVFDAAFKAVGDFNTEALTIAEVVLDLLSQVGDVHHDFGEPVLPQQLQQKLHHGFLQDGDHRLGDRVRNGPHPCSLASSQDHRLHGRQPRRTA